MTDWLTANLLLRARRDAMYEQERLRRAAEAAERGARTGDARPLADLAPRVVR